MQRRSSLPNSKEPTPEKSKTNSIFSPKLHVMHILDIAEVMITEKADMGTVWDVRKSGLGLLLSKRSYSRAIAFIEDISIAPGNLADFIEEFTTYLNEKGNAAGIYGHIGSGCMHIRPYIDLRNPNEVATGEANDDRYCSNGKEIQRSI